MKYEDVTSSALARIGYDPDTQTLALIWKKGDEYHYAGVDQAAYDEVRTADSVGRAAMSLIVSRCDERGYTMKRIAK